MPTVVGAYPDSGRMALVREFVPGIELELRAGRQPGIRPWETLAAIMATIHGVDGARLEDILPGSSTRRDHAQAALRVFDGLDHIEFRRPAFGPRHIGRHRNEASWCMAICSARTFSSIPTARLP